MKIMKMHCGSLGGVTALVLALGASVRADTVPLETDFANPFEMSRFHANPPADPLEKEPVPSKSDIPQPGEGHLLADFVYYGSLDIRGGVSLFGTGGGGGFAGGGFVGGSGGGDGTGGSTQTGPSEDDEEYDEESMPQTPVPGAALLGMMGMGMTGWVRRRWA